MTKLLTLMVSQLTLSLFLSKASLLALILYLPMQFGADSCVCDSGLCAHFQQLQHE